MNDKLFEEEKEEEKEEEEEEEGNQKLSKNFQKKKINKRNERVEASNEGRNVNKRGAQPRTRVWNNGRRERRKLNAVAVIFCGPWLNVGGARGWWLLGRAR